MQHTIAHIVTASTNTSVMININFVMTGLWDDNAWQTIISGKWRELMQVVDNPNVPVNIDIKQPAATVTQQRQFIQPQLTNTSQAVLPPHNINQSLQSQYPQLSTTIQSPLPPAPTIQQQHQHQQQYKSNVIKHRTGSKQHNRHEQQGTEQNTTNIKTR